MRTHNLPPPTREGYVTFLHENYEGGVRRALAQAEMRSRSLRRRDVIQRFRGGGNEYGKFNLHGTDWLKEFDEEVMDLIHYWNLYKFSRIHEQR